MSLHCIANDGGMVSLPVEFLSSTQLFGEEVDVLKENFVFEDALKRVRVFLMVNHRRRAEGESFLTSDVIRFVLFPMLIQKELSFPMLSTSALQLLQGAACADNIREFYSRLEQKEIFELILAGNYIGHSGVVDAGARATADMIRGKTPGQLREIFNINPPERDDDDFGWMSE